MNEEGKFWVCIWSLVAVTLITIATLVALNEREIARVVAGSADPVATACALSGNSHSGMNAKCVVLLQRGK